MKRAVATVKANPIKSAIAALILSGGATGGANYDYIISWITLPEKVARIERYMKADIKNRVESGDMTIREALDLMFPSDTADGG